MEDFATVYSFSPGRNAGWNAWCGNGSRRPTFPSCTRLIERPTATLELTAFATRHGNEGRVDNVLLSIVGEERNGPQRFPRIHVRTCEQTQAEFRSADDRGEGVRTRTRRFLPSWLASLGARSSRFCNMGGRKLVYIPSTCPMEEAVHDKATAVLSFRFPQEGQGRRDLAGHVAASEFITGLIKPVFFGANHRPGQLSPAALTSRAGGGGRRPSRPTEAFRRLLRRPSPRRQLSSSACLFRAAGRGPRPGQGAPSDGPLFEADLPCPPPFSPAPLITLQQVSMRFRHPARAAEYLPGRPRAARTLVVIGESGCGKDRPS